MAMASPVSRIGSDTPRKLQETIFTDRGLRLPPLVRARPERWPWIVLVASPVVGVTIAVVRHFAVPA